MSVTQTDLDNVEADLNTIATVTNGAIDHNGNGIVTSRTGREIKTLAKAVNDVHAELLSAAVLYETTAEGLAGTSDGEFFSVPSDDGTLLTLYQNVAGVATEINTYPSTEGIQAMVDETQKYKTASFEELCARMANGETVKVACYGDSTTDGTATTDWVANPVSGSTPVGGDHNADAPNSWPVKLQAILRDMFDNTDIHVYNAGFTGRSLDDGWALTNYEAAVTGNASYGVVDMVFVAFGLNDDAGGATTVLDNHLAQTRLLCAKIIEQGATPVLLTSDTFWRGAYGGDDRDFMRVSRRINEAKIGLASEMGIKCFDVSEALQRWFDQNNDNVMHSEEQTDALHIEDKGHAFKAGFIASKIFRDTVVVRDGIERITVANPKGSSLISSTTYNYLDSGLRTRLNVNLPEGSYVAGAEALTMWVWNEAPEACLVYRSVGTGRHYDANRSGVSLIKVVEKLGDTNVFYAKNPSEGNGGNSVNYMTMNRPSVITQLPYGLSKCTLEAPSTGLQWYYGFFEVYPICLAGKKRTDRFVYGHSQVNALREVGELYYKAPAASGATIVPVPEANDLSNITSFGHDNETVTIRCRAQIDVGYGVGFLAGRGWVQSPAARIPRIGLQLYRVSSTSFRLYAYRKLVDGTISYVAVGSLWTDARTGVQDYRVVLDRLSGTGVLRIRVYDAWEGGTLLSTYELESTIHIAAAGVAGDLFANTAAVGFDATNGIINVKNLILSHA